MPSYGATHPGRTTSVGPGDPLVPLLPLEGGAPDPVAIATWHQALGASTAVEVPHDFFALWLFSASGGIVLLGPEALARDRIDVPIPDPALRQDQLFKLEEVLRRAKYSSAIAVPVSRDGRDVAVMLLGSFQRAAFGPAQALALHRLAAALETTLSSLALVMPSVTTHPAVEPAMSAEELPGHLARAAVESASGPDLVRRVSGVLYPLLPHDRVEILAVSAGGSLVPFSGNAPRRRWTARGGTVEPFAAIVSRFGHAPTLLIEYPDELGADGAWNVGSGAAPAQPARAVIGARLEVGGQVVGYLLLGSVARDAYRPEDEDTLAIAARLVAARVHGLRLAAEVDGLRAIAGAVETPALHLIRSALALAVTSHLGEALREFGNGLRELLPHEAMFLHLRRGDDEVIAIDPEAPRPFADLPGIPIASFEGGPVLSGEREWLVRSVEGAEEIVVALRVAGRAVGTLGVRGRNFVSTREAAAVAQQFADILAPHLELLRRGAAVSSPPKGASARLAP
jgi:hypothetical protein